VQTHRIRQLLLATFRTSLGVQIQNPHRPGGLGARPRGKLVKPRSSCYGRSCRIRVCGVCGFERPARLLKRWRVPVHTCTQASRRRCSVAHPRDKHRNQLLTSESCADWPLQHLHTQGPGSREDRGGPREGPGGREDRIHRGFIGFFIDELCSSFLVLIANHVVTREVHR
jgi:hypothetical protein